MSRHDTTRRATTVALMVLCLALVPAWAQARFNDAGTGAVAVGTATVVAPTGITGSFQCYRTTITEGARFTVTGLSGGAAGATYRYWVTKGTSATAYGTQTTANRPVTVDSGAQGIDLGTTRWTLNVRAVAGTWTSTVLSREISCPAGGTPTGAL